MVYFRVYTWLSLNLRCTRSAGVLLANSSSLKAA